MQSIRELLKILYFCNNILSVNQSICPFEEKQSDHLRAQIYTRFSRSLAESSSWQDAVSPIAISRFVTTLNSRFTVVTPSWAVLIIKILFRNKRRKKEAKEKKEEKTEKGRGEKWSDKRNEPIVGVKAFPFNYNRSQQGIAFGIGATGSAGGAVLSAVSRGGSYTGVKTTTQICRTFYLPPFPPSRVVHPLFVGA